MLIMLIHSTDEQKVLIMEGMKHWEDNTCIRFYPRVDEKNYIHFLASELGLAIIF